MPLPARTVVGARTRKRATLGCAAVALGLFLTAAPAHAASPQLTVTSVSQPTNLVPGDSSGAASLQVTVINTGTTSTDGTPLQITEEPPEGISIDPVGARGERVATRGSNEITCAGRSCTFNGTLSPDESVHLTFPIDIAPGPFAGDCPIPFGASGCLTNLVHVSGGGARDASMSTPIVISSRPAEFGFAPGGAVTVPSTLQAGAHPDFTTAIAFNTVQPNGALAAAPKDTVDALPVGFAGDLVDTPTCSLILFGHGECPVGSQVGVATIKVFSFGRSDTVSSIEPVYNLDPNPGEVAKIGFPVLGIFNVQGGVTVTPGTYGLRAAFEDTNETRAELDSVALTIWGVPNDPAHNALRLEGVGTEQHFGAPPAGSPAPYFTNPTACGTGEMAAEFISDSWEEPGMKVSTSMPFGPIVGCDRLGIEPALEARPTSTSAESATGLDVNLQSPQHYDNAGGLVASNLDDVRVTLPAGMTLNPSAGSGLGSCTAAEFAYEGTTASPVFALGCPNESKIGTVQVKSPALTEEATGSLFVAKPFENPFNSLLALYLVARIPDRGVVVTAAGKVTPDPVSGQLTTSFEENPQLPFSDFTLAFRQGATSPLVTPAVCGHFTTASVLTPWSMPSQEHSVPSSFDITSGVGGGACPAGSTPPFHPGLVAGTVNNSAGSYSPFYARISRNDGEQEITHFSIKLPPGVLANLSGVAKCSDAQIAAARAREHEQGGAEEEASPSCPASSEVGHTLVEAGVGTVLAQAPGKLYLAGPYHGAQLSIVSITAAKVGPFDLGTVVVREALKIDPETLEVSAEGAGSDPIPHIIDGIPVHARNIRIYVDRPHFSLNPTSCEPTSTASTVLGSGKDFTTEADDQPVTVTSRFQAASCASLAFKPKLQLQLRGGKTSRGGLPGLKATVTYPKQGAYANIAEAQVTLPPSEFLEQGHLKNVCPRSIWIQGTVPGEKCPANSIYGHARATTPLLSEPLTGPVYLRTGYGTRLPELVAALNAQEINVDVVGEIDSVHQKGSEVSLLRNTFKTVPDAPVTKFELELKGAKKGLLVNSTNICKGTHKALAAFTGQNGKLAETEPTVEATSCKGAGKKGAKGKKSSHKKGAGQGKGGHAKKGH